MPNYLKPQSPLYHKEKDTYFYPLTTADQVITSTGERLNSLFKKTIRESATLRATDWSETLPYTQTITLTESTDDYNVDVNIVYNDTDNTTLNKAAGCLSYIKKNHKDITFYCLKSKPTIDIPIDIIGTCRNTIATVEEGTKLNFDIKRYNTEEELLADTPKENTIGIISDVEINGYRFSAIEPEGINDGEVWIETGTKSDVVFDIIDGITVHPISVKQYITDAWVDVEVKSYQNGEWVEWWNGELYDVGNQYEDITGGWEFNTSLTVRGINNPDIRAKFDSDHIYVTEPSVVNTKKKIDLSRYNRLCFDVDVLDSADGDRFGVFENFNNKEFYNYENVYTASVQSSKTGRHTIDLDISSLKDSYYVAVCTSGNNRKVYKVWLE